MGKVVIMPLLILAIISCGFGPEEVSSVTINAEAEVLKSARAKEMLDSIMAFYGAVDLAEKCSEMSYTYQFQELLDTQYVFRIGGLISCDDIERQGLSYVFIGKLNGWKNEYIGMSPIVFLEIVFSEKQFSDLIEAYGHPEKWAKLFYFPDDNAIIVKALSTRNLTFQALEYLYKEGEENEEISRYHLKGTKGLIVRCELLSLISLKE